MENFKFHKNIQENLKDHIYNNYTNINEHMINDIIYYVSKQNMSYEKTLNALQTLLASLGITKEEIETVLQEKVVIPIPYTIKGQITVNIKIPIEHQNDDQYITAIANKTLKQTEFISVNMKSENVVSDISDTEWEPTITKRKD